MSDLTYVIKRPIVSEKSTMLAEVGNRYAFEVLSSVTKPQIKQAIEGLFKVKVKRVHTLIMQGKEKRAGRATKKKPNWKKAIVTVEAGQKIDFFNTK